jgi:hypothetical protein
VQFVRGQVAHIGRGGGTDVEHEAGHVVRAADAEKLESLIAS